MRQHNYLTHHVGLSNVSIFWTTYISISHMIKVKNTSHMWPLPFSALLRQRFVRQHNHPTHHVGLRQHILDRLRQR